MRVRPIQNLEIRGGGGGLASKVESFRSGRRAWSVAVRLRGEVWERVGEVCERARSVAAGGGTKRPPSGPLAKPSFFSRSPEGGGGGGFGSMSPPRAPLATPSFDPLANAGGGGTLSSLSPDVTPCLVTSPARFSVLLGFRVPLPLLGDLASGFSKENDRKSSSVSSNAKLIAGTRAINWFIGGVVERGYGAGHGRRRRE